MKILVRQLGVRAAVRPDLHQLLSQFCEGRLQGDAARKAVIKAVDFCVDGEVHVDLAVDAVRAAADAAPLQAILPWLGAEAGGGHRLRHEHGQHRFHRFLGDGPEGPGGPVLHGLGDEVPGVGHAPVTLCLDAAVKSESLDISGPCEAIKGALWEMPPSFEWGHPVDLKGAHPFTKLALEMVPAWGGQAVKELHVYTDGSHTPQRTGWAFCVVAHLWDGSHAFVGFARGIAEQWTQSWVARLDPDNNVAELVGMFNAIYWRVATLSCFGPEVDVSFHADNAMAFMGPAMDAFSHKLAPLLIQLEAITQLLRNAMGSSCAAAGVIQFRHVQAHSGHPWNEAADWLSTNRADHLQINTRGPHHLWRDDPHEVAAALRMMDWSEKGIGPLVMDEVVLHVPSEAPVLPPELALGVPLQPHGAQDDIPPQLLEANFAVSNVLSLSPQEEKGAPAGPLEVTARMEELQMTFLRHEVHLAGVLESRLPGKGLRRT